jgi:excinuclease UvrABC nuclease subunit
MSQGAVSLIDLKGKLGIYSLYDENGNCAYVGKADCLYSRLTTHFKNKMPMNEIGLHNIGNEAKDLTYIEVKWLLRYYEACTIHQKKPYLNKMNPFSKPNAVLKFLREAPLRVQRIINDKLPSLNVPHGTIATNS